MVIATIKLASAGYTVHSKAADKLFSSTMSTPAASANPNCLDSQDTAVRSQSCNSPCQKSLSLLVARQSRKLHSVILYSSMGQLQKAALSTPAVSNVCCFCLAAISLCSIPAMYADNNGLLQIHIQHLDWHSQTPMTEVQQRLRSQLGPSLPHAHYVFLNAALKPRAQPGEPFKYLGRIGLPLLQLSRAP